MLAAKARDVLPDAIFFDREVVLPEPGHKPPDFVRHRERHIDEIDIKYRDLNTPRIQYPSSTLIRFSNGSPFRNRTIFSANRSMTSAQ